MTREEAIICLQGLLDNPLINKGSYLAQAIEMAIQALSQEPCDDVVSRQAVIYYIKGHIHEIITESGTDKNAHTNSILKALINGVETMPAVNPQPCEDAISRKDIQDYIAKYLSQYLYEDVRQAVEVIDAYIGDMPSVTQKPGKWIDREVYDADRWKCSACGRTEPYREDYCPNCGAKMESEEKNDNNKNV